MEKVGDEAYEKGLGFPLSNNWEQAEEERALKLGDALQGGKYAIAARGRSRATKMGPSI